MHNLKDLSEMPQAMKGNSKFKEDLEYITSVSKRIMDMDYSLVKQNLIKSLDLYKHKQNSNKHYYYVLGRYSTGIKLSTYTETKERFGVITDLSFNIEERFRSKQKQLKNKSAVIISTIHTCSEWQGQHLSSALYSYIINQDFMIISDSMQYQGAVQLWKGFLKVPNSVIYIYDTLEDKIISKYASNTSDKSVWTDDESKRRIRLIFMKI